MEYNKLPKGKNLKIACTYYPIISRVRAPDTDYLGPLLKVSCGSIPMSCWQGHYLICSLESFSEFYCQNSIFAAVGWRSLLSHCLLSGCHSEFLEDALKAQSWAPFTAEYFFKASEEFLSLSHFREGLDPFWKGTED